MRRPTVGGLTVWILGLGALGLVAWGLGQWSEFAVTRHLCRLRAEPEYLRQVLANPGSGVAGRALARYLRETGGREALFRLALSEAPGYEDDIERALATGSSAVHFFSYGCVWGGPRSMDDATARAMLRWLAKLDEGELRLPEYPLLRFRFGSTLDPENMKGLCSIENLGEPTGIGEVDDEGDEAALRDDDVERLLEEIAAQVDDGASG